MVQLDHNERENMSNKLKEFFGIGDDELEEIGIEEAPPPDPNAENIQWIVYYKGDAPDCAWSYNHNPPPELDENGKPQLDADGDEVRIPYGRLEGYWEEDKDAKIARHFEHHQSTNLKLMDYDTFMENVVPNKDCTKVFDSEADFLLELI
jgi:hypothetical protein